MHRSTTQQLLLPRRSLVASPAARPDVLSADAEYPSGRTTRSPVRCSNPSYRSILSRLHIPAAAPRHATHRSRPCNYVHTTVASHPAQPKHIHNRRSELPGCRSDPPPDARRLCLRGALVLLTVSLNRSLIAWQSLSRSSTRHWATRCPVVEDSTSAPSRTALWSLENTVEIGETRSRYRPGRPHGRSSATTRPDGIGTVHSLSVWRL